MEVLDGFFAGLQALQSGKSVRLRVAQFGDSHTAGESWPGKFRERLQQRFGSGGRGFLFPGKPQKYHLTLGARTGQSDGWESGNVLYATSSSKKSLAGWGVFGPAGYSLCSRKAGADVWLELNDPQGATDAIVYFAKQEEPGRLQIFWGDTGEASVSTKGEAGQLGTYVVHFEPAEPRRLMMRVQSGAVCMLGTAFENDQPGVVLDGLGVNGARLSTLGRLTASLLQAIGINRPWDLIVLAYGTNEAGDAQFDAARYEEVARKGLQLMRGNLPGTACLMVGPPAFGAKRHGQRIPNPNIDALQLVLKKLAAEQRCAYFDLYRWMGGEGAMERWFAQGPKVVESLQRAYDLKLDATLVEKARSGELPLLGKDLVHMHTAGYHLVAEVVYAALMVEFEAYLSRGEQ